MKAIEKPDQLNYDILFESLQRAKESQTQISNQDFATVRELSASIEALGQIVNQDAVAEQVIYTRS